jgi:hypothetical protein
MKSRTSHRFFGFSDLNQSLNHFPKAAPKNRVRSQGNSNEEGADSDLKRRCVRSQKHEKLDSHGKNHSPQPGPALRVADERQVHYSERGAITEVVAPTYSLGQCGIHRLFNGLAEDHRSKPRKDFKKRKVRNDICNLPFFRENEWHSKDIVSNRGDQSGDAANQHHSPKPAVPSKMIPTRHQSQANRRRQKHEEHGRAHRAKLIEFRKQTGNGSRSQQKTNPAAKPLPMQPIKIVGGIHPVRTRMPNDRSKRLIFTNGI